MAFISQFLTAMLDNNLVFCQLVAMVSVIMISHRPQDAVRDAGVLGIACAVCGIVNWFVVSGTLRAWGVTYLAPIACVLVNASLVMVFGTIAGVRRSSEERTQILRHSTVLACCAALMAPALSQLAQSDVLVTSTAIADSLGAGAGVFLSVVLFSFVRGRIDDSACPHAMRGLPITLVAASLMALAFTGVAGIAGGLLA